MSGNGRRPAILVDPARKLGLPALDGTRIDPDVVAHAVWNRGLTATEAATQLGIDRRQVIVACWFRATWSTSDYQRKTWRRRWGAWAAAAAPHLDREAWQRVPDPPSPARPGPTYHLDHDLGPDGVCRTCGPLSAVAQRMRREAKASVALDGETQVVG